MSIRLRHSARLESLADALAADLANDRPVTAFALQTVVVAHPGMARWLRAALAKRSEQGISAGCEFLLPGEFLQRLAHDVPGTSASSDATDRPEVMQLALFDVFAEGEFARPGETSDERFRRAGIDAECLHRLAIYRGSALSGPATGPLARHIRMWRRVRQRLGDEGRPRRVLRVADHLAGQEGSGRSPLWLFGLGHCPPDLLEVLRLLADVIPVSWYFVNPCREYWSDFVGPRKLTRARIDGTDQHAEAGPPLLSSLGDQGRDLFDALLGADADESAIEADVSFAPGRLGHLQRAIVENVVAPRWLPDPADRSLVIHGCASPWAELEQVREALDAALTKAPDLRPDEVLIMAVDPSRYRPFIDAVFEKDLPAWPVRVADTDWLTEDAWFQLIPELLSMMGEPVRRSSWTSVMQHPEVIEHWQLDPEVLPKLSRALDHVHASFGIDGIDRGDGSNEHALGTALSRLWDRYAGDHAADDWALTGIEARMLAQAEAILVCLHDWRLFSSAPHQLESWCARLRQAVLALCGDGDAAHANARNALFTMLATLTERAGLAHADSPLPASAFAQSLKALLDAPSMDSPAIGGGIRFSGLVPFRSLPFRFIAMLGLNDGAFPRLDVWSGDDPMRVDRRPLDRDRRLEDRYLFLETLLSAREWLHLSFLAKAPEDGSELAPSSVLAELVQQLDAGDGFPERGLDRRATRSWFIHHPVLPFAKARFGVGSFASAWSDAATAFSTTDRRGSWSGSRPTAGTVSLADLQAFLRHPAEWFVRRQLGVHLKREFWRDPDLEPLSERLQSVTRWKTALIALALDEGELPEHKPASWGELGIFPEGQLGRQAFTALRKECLELIGRGGHEFAKAWHTPQRIVRINALPVGPWQLDGRVRLYGHDTILPDVHPSPGALLAGIAGQIVASLVEPGTDNGVHFLFEMKRSQRPVDRWHIVRLKSPFRLSTLIESPVDWLQSMIACWADAQAAIPRLPMDAGFAAWRYMEGDATDRIQWAESAFRSDPGSAIPASRGEHADPWWRVLIGDDPLLPDSACQSRFLEHTERLFGPLFPGFVKNVAGADDASDTGDGSD